MSESSNCPTGKRICVAVRQSEKEGKILSSCWNHMAVNMTNIQWEPDYMNIYALERPAGRKRLAGG